MLLLFFEKAININLELFLACVLQILEEQLAALSVCRINFFLLCVCVCAFVFTVFCFLLTTTKSVDRSQTHRECAGIAAESERQEYILFLTSRETELIQPRKHNYVTTGSTNPIPTCPLSFLDA